MAGTRHLLIVLLFLGTGHQLVQNTNNQQGCKQKTIMPRIKNLLCILSCGGNFDWFYNQLPKKSDHGNLDEYNHMKKPSLHIVDFGRNQT